jgi:hypothetical protein
MKNRRAIGIELFAGCGGLSTGFLDAGLPLPQGLSWMREPWMRITTTTPTGAQLVSGAT